MAKRAAVAASANDFLPEAAQKQLAALRGEMESRLATLEQVLADPSRGESLAGLILDLSRVATEEAQAAAAHACLAAKTEADKQVADARASLAAALESTEAALQSATASLEMERATGQDLRRETDAARAELGRQAALIAGREQADRDLESAREEIARHAAAAADLRRTAAEAQQQLEGERRAAAGAKEQLESERRGAADAKQQLEAERRVATDAKQQLEAERQATADAKQQLVAERLATAAAQAQIKEEKKAAADIRKEAERIAERLSALEREHAEFRQGHERAADEARAAHAALTQELERERDAAAGRERAGMAVKSDIDAVRMELESERSVSADLRRAVQQAQEQNAALGQVSARSDADREELEALQREIATLSRAPVNGGDQALAEAQADLEQERATNANLRRAAANIDQQLASSRSNEVQMLANVDQLSAQIARERADAAATIDGLRAELQAAQKWRQDMHAAEAEFTAPAAATASVVKPKAAAPPRAQAAPPAAKTPALVPPIAPPEEGWQAVRLASRYMFEKGITVQINGDPGTLFDVSITGCQLLSPSALKPNQVVKVQLSTGQPPVTCSGKVVWTRLEPAAKGQLLSYRAGVRFTKADEAAIEAFAVRNGASVVPDSDPGTAP